jgi:hypothetical protein
MPMYCHNPQPYPFVCREIVVFPQKKPANMLQKTRLVATRRTVAKPPAAALDDGVLGNGGDVDGDGVEAKVLEQVLGLGVNLELASLGEVEGGNLGDVLILALTLLFLELEGDTADGATLNALHQVGCVAGNLVAQPLGGDDGNLIAHPLVGLEVERQLGVVPLNDDLGGLLDSLGTNATHLDGLVSCWLFC